MHLCAGHAKLLVAASNGKGFIVESDDVVAQTRGGKQILNVDGRARRRLPWRCGRSSGDHVAVIGDNRKMLIFPLSQLPPMKRGQGCDAAKI